MFQAYHLLPRKLTSKAKDQLLEDDSFPFRIRMIFQVLSFWEGRSAKSAPCNLQLLAASVSFREAEGSAAASYLLLGGSSQDL